MVLVQKDAIFGEAPGGFFEAPVDILAHKHVAEQLPNLLESGD